MVRAMQGETTLQQIAIVPLRRVRDAGRRTPAGQVVRTVLLIGTPLLLVGLLVWPMLFTHAEFNKDWLHHLWYMWHQSLSIRENHRPSFFLNYPHSVFYPEYAFYGGTLYAVVGTLSLILGNAPIEAYILAYVLGFCAAYGGWYWMARMAGLGRWWAQIPGVLFITSAYYLTLIYARGDLPEFLGVSTIPLLIASGLSVLRAERLHQWPALALMLSGIMFFGSHSLTLIWGATSMVLVSVVVVVCIPQARRWLTRRSILRVAVLVIPSLLVSAWFLLPAIVYQSHTFISIKFPFEGALRSTMYLVSAQHLFTLSRASAATPGTDFVLSLSVLAMAWAALSICIFWRGQLRGAWVRMLLICVGSAIVVIVMMTNAGLVLALPRPYANLQFAYRLESYVMLAVSGAVLAGLAVARNGSRRIRIWAWTLVPITAVAVAGAIQQTAAYPRGGARTVVAETPTKQAFANLALFDYSDGALTFIVDRQGPAPEVVFPASKVHDDHISQVVHVAPHQLVYSNIAAGPELVHITGAKIVGRDPEGNDVLEIGPSTGRSEGHAKAVPTEVIAVSQARSLPIVLGRLLSLAGIIFLVAVNVTLAARRQLERRASRV
jgi:hypothetical protein